MVGVEEGGVMWPDMGKKNKKQTQSDVLAVYRPDGSPGALQLLYYLFQVSSDSWKRAASPGFARFVEKKKSKHQNSQNAWLFRTRMQTFFYE